MKIPLIQRLIRVIVPAPMPEVTACAGFILAAGVMFYSGVRLWPDTTGTRGLTGVFLVALHWMVAASAAAGIVYSIKRDLPRPWWICWALWASALLIAGALAFLNFVALSGQMRGGLPPADWGALAPVWVRAAVMAADGVLVVGLTLGGRLPSDREGRASVLPRGFLAGGAAGVLGMLAAARYLLAWDYFAACGAALAAVWVAAALLTRAPEEIHVR